MLGLTSTQAPLVSRKLAVGVRARCCARILKRWRGRRGCWGRPQFSFDLAF
jgi:hypothetical protein